MPRNKLSDLRDHLFETIEALKDDEKPMDLDRARAIGEVAQVIINSAKAEVDLVKAVSGSRPGSLEFFGLPEESRELPRAAKGTDSTLRQIRSANA